MFTISSIGRYLGCLYFVEIVHSEELLLSVGKDEKERGVQQLVQTLPVEEGKAPSGGSGLCIRSLRSVFVQGQA